MRQTVSLPTSWFSLVRWVFAGCRQSLLGDGPSRHYLCNPCIGARTLTPQRPFGALTRFFPKDFGLTSRFTSSTRQISAAMQLQRRGNISGLQSFHNVQAPILAGKHSTVYCVRSKPLTLHMLNHITERRRAKPRLSRTDRHWLRGRRPGESSEIRQCGQRDW